MITGAGANPRTAASVTAAPFTDFITHDEQ
jgi:hypothetical protein